VLRKLASFPSDAPRSSGYASMGINSRTSGLLWRPSILRALSFWDTEGQISPLPFSGQTNGQVGSLRDTVSSLQHRRFDESDSCEINGTTRNRSIARMTRHDPVISSCEISHRTTSLDSALRIRSPDCQFTADHPRFDRLTVIAVTDRDYYMIERKKDRQS